MPRIAAPTVAEHRARQYDALLTAARDIALSEGVQAVTPAAVGARAGLARSSVYKYFSSTAEIYARLVEEAFDRWAARLETACAAEPDPSARIAAYARTTLELAAAGEHRLANALSGVDRPAACGTRIRELHNAMEAPLRTALVERGDPTPRVTAALIRGVIDGGVRLVEAGVPFAEVAPAVLGFLAAHPPGTAPRPGAPCPSGEPSEPGEPARATAGVSEAAGPASGGEVS